MSEIKELLALTGFGNSLEGGYILAAHPDEMMAPNGWDPSTTRRTFILRINNKTTDLIEIVPAPLSEAWCSNNGTAYCTAVMQDFIYIFADGQWTKETFSTKTEFVNFVWGFSGQTPEEDTVYLCAEGGSLFVRQRGKWTEYSAPGGANDIFHLHGLSSSEVYLCGDNGLLLWDGQAISEVEGPEECNPSGICVLSNQSIITVAKYMHTCSESSGWNMIETEYEDFQAILTVKNEVFAGTSESGVVRIFPLPPTQVTTEFDCLRLCPLGGGILAAGTESCHLYDGKTWVRLQLPRYKTEDTLD